jgi:high-affinity iron transporter
MFVPAVAAVVLLSLAPPSATPFPPQPRARDAARRVAVTVHLAVQEYALAWDGHTLVRPEEAVEARLFVSGAMRTAAALPPDLAPDVKRGLDAITGLFARAAHPDSVAAEAAKLERRLASRMGGLLDERPPRSPSLEVGAHLYATRCSSCHGAGGHGDGPEGTGLNPPPANLVAVEDGLRAVPLDYFRRLTYGVPGTAMAPFGTVLSPAQRWDVIAYVASLSDTVTRRARNGSDILAFATVRGTLARAIAATRRGDRRAAADQVFDAYLAFESVEGSVRVADAGLASRAEQRFAALREAVARGPAAGSSTAPGYALLARTLDSAEAALGGSRSGGGLFAESFLLIVREGFEAILIVAAIMAVVIRGGSARQRRGVRWGVGLAIAASLLTAAALDRLVQGSAAHREAIEGGVMLAAAGLLFYVSYWLISKVETAAWQRFVREKIEAAAAGGGALALASVAFLAVYREGFETVLFYKALYGAGEVAAAGGGAPAVTAGLVAGLLALILLYVAIERFGVRIPLKPFFAVTGATLLLLSFIFAGAGVKELQEGAVIPTTLVPGAPRSVFFGIYPTVQSLALQAMVLASVVVAAAITLSRRRHRPKAR